MENSEQLERSEQPADTNGWSSNDASPSSEESEEIGVLEFDEDSSEAESTERSTPNDEALDEERRRAYRLNKVLGATLTTPDGTSEKARLFVIDISATGFRATDHRPHGEQEYEISIVLRKDDEPFQSRMKVVWTKELTVSGMFQMGCQFIDPSEENLVRLTRFLKEELQRSEPAKKSQLEFGHPWTMIR